MSAVSSKAKANSRATTSACGKVHPDALKIASEKYRGTNRKLLVSRTHCMEKEECKEME